MSSRRTPPSGARGSPTEQLPPPAERELIVIAQPAAQLTFTPSGYESAPGVDLAPMTDVLSKHRATLKPLFEGGGTRAAHAAAIAELTAPPGSPPPPDFSVYFKVEAPDQELDALAEELRNTAPVEAAYVKGPTYPATAVGSGTGTSTRSGIGTYEPMVEQVVEINAMAPKLEEAPPATPDFTPRQGYLGAAPAGIEALFAHTQPGGRGANVRIIDIEGAWRFTHEDLTQSQGGVVAGTQSTDLGWRNHGTAVTGEFGGDTNGFGITGICPDANVRAISIFGLGSAPAIRRAADLLGPGDIILIELHRPGPRATGVGQQGFIALEWWPDDFDAIRYATSRGVIVVEAAGNGAENLDDPAYDTPAPGFPSTWANPFRRGARDSGAILVGAGAPPPGTHGRDHGPDRSRLGFSNFGAALDAQGWGREVTTSGYGDLQGGPDEDFWYTDQFSGTSSASPIVVGALGCLQGNRRARGLAPLTPMSARNLLRTTGSPQQDAPMRPAVQRIGSRPNLRQMIGPVVALTVPLFRYWNPHNTDHFYTTNWAELGSGRYGWAFEGIQCYVVRQQVVGTVPLYRYWNPQIGDHFYTTNFSELGRGQHGYRYEGIQCFVYPQTGPGRSALFRYWNGHTGDHFYTTNFNELRYGRYGYRLEGIQCYVATQVRPPEAEEGESALQESEPTFAMAPARGFEPGSVPELIGNGGQEMKEPEYGVPDTFSTPGAMASGIPSSFAGPSEEAGMLSAPESFTGGGQESFRPQRLGGSKGASIHIRLGGDE